MKSFKLNEYHSIPFNDEVAKLREAGDNKEAFELVDNLTQAATEEEKEDA